jgi:hypothetical protein
LILRDISPQDLSQEVKKLDPRFEAVSKSVSKLYNCRWNVVLQPRFLSSCFNPGANCCLKFLNHPIFYSIFLL